MEQGETSVLSCLVNAASDKVVYCRKYGVEITPEQWPSAGLPKRILIDRGTEFSSARVGELCIKYGLEVERLPPFRPDQKGLVEKSFDMLQEKYKPYLRGNGVIEPDAQERWSVDYRMQASLTLYEFTAIVLQCIVYLNSARVLKNLLPEQADSVPTAAGLWKWCIERGYSDMLVIPQRELYLSALPREIGKMTRTGLIYKKLRYINLDYKEEFFVASKDGIQRVTIAVDPESTNQVFWIREGEYIPFQLAPASHRFGDMNFAEYELLIREMRAQAKKQAVREVEAHVALGNSIRDVVKNGQEEGDEE